MSSPFETGVPTFLPLKIPAKDFGGRFCLVFSPLSLVYAIPYCFIQ
ncbi:hypothetical protein Krac_9437 [Ktedonobacter racemifer DSM 44963]|uniref:Uncharacterized protein n=1 Tax=Ktedonobacter racemifer DSM 44963 TaxID=485913 RepID=D6TC24_KTERA|nr:hypothetical protein Krac_9437 [Ktedonobacter racemifer DSM 44963]